MLALAGIASGPENEANLKYCILGHAAAERKGTRAPQQIFAGFLHTCKAPQGVLDSTSAQV